MNASNPQPSPAPTLRAWLRERPFCLGLSSGFFGFFAHCGMVMALEEAGLFPERLAGSSAGALVAGSWASGLTAGQIATELLSLTRADFWDPWPGLGLLRGKKFRRKLERFLPVGAFEECRWPFAASTFDLLAKKTRVLDAGALIPAIHASCAVPFLFQPVWLGKRPCLDGGIADRHGVAGIPPGARLFHHLLTSRSPWRRKNSPALRPLSRANTTTLMIRGLPRSGPGHLENGRVALQQAHAATRRALDLPLVEGVVDVAS